MSMSMSDDGVKLMTRHEGFRSEPYNDMGRDKGNCTVYYGHMVHTGPCLEQDYRAHWKAEDGPKHLKNDLSEAERYVAHYVKIPLNQNQFDALVSFTYNVGPGHAKSVFHLINKGHFDKVPAKMKEFVYATIQDNKGHKRKMLAKGLVSRRNDEARLFAVPVPDTELHAQP
jgi:GH24 family phage-related lysozyme (muramidase)